MMYNQADNRLLTRLRDANFDYVGQRRELTTKQVDMHLET